MAARRSLRTESMGVLRDLVREWREDRLTGLAAEVAFYLVLGLFPAMLAVASMLGFLQHVAGADLADRASEAIADGLVEMLGSTESSATVDAVDGLFRDARPGLLTFALASALWASSRGFVAVIRALDEVYDLDERRSFAALRGVAVALALGTILVVSLVVAMIIVGPLLGTGRDVADAVGAGGAFALVWDWIRWPVVVVILVSWLATIFHVAPHHRTPWRADLPGAMATAVLWALLSVGLRTYLSVLPEANAVSGALGGALTVLLWLYLLALGLLVGGEINAILEDRRNVRLREAEASAGDEAGRLSTGRRWMRDRGADDAR